jgi:hypothetical protein
MRHSCIQLTMNVYTDPNQLAVRDALDKLPGFSREVVPQENPHRFPHLLNDSTGQNGAFTVKEEQILKCENKTRQAHETLGNVDEKTPVTTLVITGVMSGRQNTN